MKRLKHVITIVLLIALCCVFLSCIVKNAKVISAMNKIEDTSNNIYYVSHFSNACDTNRSLTVTNNEELYYVDGTNVYRNSDGAVVMEDVCVKELVLTANLLLILDDSFVLHIVDTFSFVDFPMPGVQDVFYKDNKIYIQPENDYNFKCVSEDKIIDVVDFDKMSDPDIDSQLAKNASFNGKYSFIFFSDRRVNTIHRSTSGNDNTEDIVVPLKDAYAIDSNNLFAKSGKAYFLYNEFTYEEFAIELTEGLAERPSFNREQYKIVCDGIAEVDFDSKKVKEIYTTEDNTTKIIGYNLTDHVYLFDTKRRLVSSLDLQTNESKRIISVPRKYSSLIFEITNNILFIYDIDKNLISTVNLRY